ncbi:hypothetical protein A2U01_0074569, partial [Trifolium medium]|nr:hypothetical protein [Trifolium medium]
TSYTSEAPYSSPYSSELLALQKLLTLQNFLHFRSSYTSEP